MPRAFVTTKFPLPGPDGETEAVGVIASDVTELRRAEADQAQLAALVEAAPDAIVARDQHGAVVTWNPGAEAMFGVRAEDAIGRSYAELVVPEDERGHVRPRRWPTSTRAARSPCARPAGARTARGSRRRCRSRRSRSSTAAGAARCR